MCNFTMFYIHFTTQNYFPFKRANILDKQMGNIYNLYMYFTSAKRRKAYYV